jgi:hypothetical protein
MLKTNTPPFPPRHFIKQIQKVTTLLIIGTTEALVEIAS